MFINNILNKKHMDSTETHLMLLKVNVHKINLSVRFPCSLTFQLKTGSTCVDFRDQDHRLQRHLRTGQGGMPTRVDASDIIVALKAGWKSVQGPAGTHVTTQVKLVVYMTSTNGKIPAGSVTITCSNLKPGASETTTSMIEKCPDKSATVHYTQSL